MTSAENVESDVRLWLTQNWDPTADLIEWRGLLADSGWGCPSWPQDWYGRGLPLTADATVKKVFSEIGAVGVAAGVSMYLVAPTLLEWGNDDQKQRFLRPILTGEDKWCQLFRDSDL